MKKQDEKWIIELIRQCASMRDFVEASILIEMIQGRKK